MIDSMAANPFPKALAILATAIPIGIAVMRNGACNRADRIGRRSTANPLKLQAHHIGRVGRPQTPRGFFSSKSRGLPCLSPKLAR